MIIFRVDLQLFLRDLLLSATCRGAGSICLHCLSGLGHCAFSWLCNLHCLSCLGHCAVSRLSNLLCLSCLSNLLCLSCLGRYAISLLHHLHADILAGQATSCGIQSQLLSHSNLLCL